MQPLAFHGHTKPVTYIKFNPEGDLLFSCGKDGNCSVWRTSDGRRLGSYEGHSTIMHLDVNRSSTLLMTAGFDLKSKLWNVNTGEEIANIPHLAPARSCGISHDDSLIFATTDNKMGEASKMHVYKLPPQAGVEPIKTKFNPIITHSLGDGECLYHACWGPTNDHIYFADNQGYVVVYDVEAQKEVRNYQAHRDEVRKISFDADYYTLISASKDKTAKLLDSRTPKPFRSYSADIPINDASISPVTDHVIIGGGTEAQEVTTSGFESKFNVRFYHKVHETFLGQIHCHFGTINTVAFHPKGTMFASGAVDGFVKVHKVDDSYWRSPGSVPVWPVPSEEEEDTNNNDDDGGDADAEDNNDE